MGQIRGQCLCGAIEFEANGDLMAPAACHCAMCRRWHGSPGVYTSVRMADFRLTGEDHLRWYRSGEQSERGFCKECGSKLFWRSLAGTHIDMTLGSLDQPADVDLKISKHIWVAHKGDYDDIADGLPQYADSSAGAEPSAPVPPAGEPGHVPETQTGQCLCGAIHLTVAGKMRDISVCHCGQCRRWHGHAPSYSKAKWSDIGLTGRKYLRWYQSSAGARRGFCSQCGSSLFWERDGADAVSIPAGLLDGPTGLRERHHIFVADKGECYEIAGQLPQFEKSGGSILPF